VSPAGPVLRPRSNGRYRIDGVFAGKSR
jgi:hypothetical protein